MVENKLWWSVKRSFPFPLKISLRRNRLVILLRELWIIACRLFFVFNDFGRSRVDQTGTRRSAQRCRCGRTCSSALRRRPGEWRIIFRQVVQGQRGLLRGIRHQPINRQNINPHRSSLSHSVVQIYPVEGIQVDVSYTTSKFYPSFLFPPHFNIFISKRDFSLRHSATLNVIGPPFVTRRRVLLEK